MKITITKAQRNQTPLILEFIRKLAIYEKLEHELVATPEKLEKELFDDKSAEVLFINENDKAVGFALYFHNFSTFLGQKGIHLEDLFVLTEKRGNGYGKKLLSYLAQLAIERNCGRLEWSVLDWNTPAIDFYKSIGAESMSEWTLNRLTGESLKNLATQNEC